jgi:hypothetical protein
VIGPFVSDIAHCGALHWFALVGNISQGHHPRSPWQEMSKRRDCERGRLTRPRAARIPLSRPMTGDDQTGLIGFLTRDLPMGDRPRGPDRQVDRSRSPRVSEGLFPFCRKDLRRSSLPLRVGVWSGAAPIKSKRPSIGGFGTIPSMAYSLCWKRSHTSPIDRMPRLYNFFNAPIADSGRNSPERFTTKADKKSKKNRKLVRRSMAFRLKP